MSGVFWLDGAAMGVSLNNTILLLWLGLSVLLNAERRGRAIWLIGGSLLLSSAFFVSHTVILALGLNPVYEASLDFWWHLGWIPVIVLPFGWYAMTLWYTGFWDDRSSGLYRRQRLWYYFAALLTMGLTALLVFANPLPSFAQAASLRLSSTPEMAGIPVLLLLYALDILLCITLSIDALRRPGPTARVMGNLARYRARPWLVAASIVLLVVGLLVASVLLWFTLNARAGTGPDHAMTWMIAWLDLIIAGLIGAAAILVGQAFALYEVFTGRVLPRRGALRQWRDAVILAAGYGLVVGSSLTLQQRPIYIVLLTTALMTIFYTLFGWRSYAERERYIRDLRPFATSPRLYDHLLATASTPPDLDVMTPFRALCQDVLAAQSARLCAVGPLAPLVPALAFPDQTQAAPLPPPEIAQFDSPHTVCLPLDPSEHGGAMWALPLWSERGLIGVLSLGEKNDGGLYTQEEIEIARATGERLIDTCASAELARRLMTLQRQRLAESQVLDRQARRVLHDEVLPRLHAAILALSAGESNGQVVDQLSQVHRETSNLLRARPTGTTPDIARLGLIGALIRAVDDEWKHDFDGVTWQLEPEAERYAKAIPSLTTEVLFYAAREAIRNAARYGRPTNAARPLNLRLQVSWQDGLKVLIEDDGVGIQAAKLTGQGSGQGLMLHSTMLAVVGGTLAVESLSRGGTRVTLTLPRGAIT